MQDHLIGTANYAFVSDFKDDAPLRRSFNALARATFAFDFEDYYQSGFWNARYIPYALLHDGQVVANVSANILTFCVLGAQKRYVQIGTVMTHKAHRSKGLSRFLLSAVLDEWQTKSELIYLFANDTVLDFYPKFGFCKKQEYQYAQPFIKSMTHARVLPMDMDEPQNRAMLFRLSDNTRSFSKLTALRNTGLVLFYATSFYKNDFYYIAELDAAVFAIYEEDTLLLNDIFCPHPLHIDAVICAMARPGTISVVLGFVPLDCAAYTCAPYLQANDTLFVRANGSCIFDHQPLMFPILSHA